MKFGSIKKRKRRDNVTGIRLSGKTDPGYKHSEAEENTYRTSFKPQIHRFREGGLPETRDPAGHQNDRRCVIWDRGDQLGEDLDGITSMEVKS
jgi:hypothetical protein